MADYRQADPEIYARALNRIEWFGNASLAGALLAALADGDYGCQAWTAAACGTLGVVAAEPLLVALLRHPDGLVQESVCEAAAAKALARIGDDQAQDALWAALQARQFDRVGYLASALASLGPQVAERLLAMIEDPDPYLRYWAARALGATGDERVRAALQRLAAHDHERTRFGGQVSTAAKKALRTLDRLQHSRS